MKLSQLKPCASCGGKIAPQFYVLRVSLALITEKSARATVGLVTMFSGNLALAEAMSPDNSPVLVMGDENPELMTELFVCFDCFNMKRVHLAELLDSANSQPGAKETEEGL